MGITLLRLELSQRSPKGHQCCDGVGHDARPDPQALRYAGQVVRSRSRIKENSIEFSRCEY